MPVPLDRWTFCLRGGRYARGLVLDGTRLVDAALTGFQDDAMGLGRVDLRGRARA
ncbi:MAG TPA: hypothetical protein VEX66_15225 [Microlunatus sp.]|nr:hypothetical protein [Microlunatus sp.]